MRTSAVECHPTLDVMCDCGLPYWMFVVQKYLAKHHSQLVSTHQHAPCYFHLKLFQYLWRELRPRRPPLTLPRRTALAGPEFGCAQCQHLAPSFALQVRICGTRRHLFCCIVGTVVAPCTVLCIGVCIGMGP
jgi:hypothetical protein